MTNLNINDSARIKLFDLGKRIVEGCLPDLEIQDNDYVEMRIAEIMKIFGQPFFHTRIIKNFNHLILILKLMKNILNQ